MKKLMKCSFLTLIAALAVILSLSGCPGGPAAATPTPAVATPTATPTGTPPGETPTPAPTPDIIELEITAYSIDPTPAGYTYNDGTITTFTVSVQNNGSDIPATEKIVVVIMVTDASGQGFNDLYQNASIMTSRVEPSGLASGASWDVTIEDQDISLSGLPGDNYYYAIAYLADNLDNLLPDDLSAADNAVQFNSTACIMADLPHSSWTAATPLAGGADPDAAVIIPSLDHWYNSSVAFPNQEWYKITIDDSTVYEVYWDCAAEGSGTYTGKVNLSIYDVTLTTLYGAAGSGYLAPILVNDAANPTTTQIYVIVESGLADGTFAFGIRAQP